MRGRQSPGGVTGGGGKARWLRLAAQYKVLEYENTRRNAPQPLSPEAQAERDAAHRLLNCCMREGDLDALKRLALKGEKPDDSVAIRHGLAEGYRRLEELSREWSEEMRGDNHTVMEQIELREADERGKLMRQAAALYERKTGGRLPGDYLEAVKAERALLHGLARHGWDGQREVPKGDGGEVRADEGLCRHRPAEVGLPPERGQRGLLP